MKCLPASWLSIAFSDTNLMFQFFVRIMIYLSDQLIAQYPYSTNESFATYDLSKLLFQNPSIIEPEP